MGDELDEIYERIPWESIDQPSDRRWLAYAVAGAITLGSLTYSIVSRPTPPPVVSETAVESSTPSTTSLPEVSQSDTAPEPKPAPMVVSEADLMAIEPDTLVDIAAAHAEWFAYEYIGFDGSVRSIEQLRALMPVDVSLPESPDGNQVWVDFARAVEMTIVGPAVFDVTVLVRSLMAVPGGEFERLPLRAVALRVRIDGEGQPIVSSAPVVSDTSRYPAASSWGEVEMVAGIDGVLRPQRPMPDQP